MLFRIVTLIFCMSMSLYANSADMYRCPDNTFVDGAHRKAGCVHASSNTCLKGTCADETIKGGSLNMSIGAAVNKARVNPTPSGFRHNL
jgi:hypothetical protein